MMEALIEECPTCGCTELHSALLDGKDAVSCTECVWIATVQSLTEDDEWDGDEDRE